MILAMVRHGQTDYNKQRLVQGRINNPLNQTGRKQARETAQVIKDTKETFDFIAASPLSRAIETAFIIKKRLNFKAPIYVTPYFVERDFTPFDGQPIEVAFPIIGSKDFNDPRYENDEALLDRVLYGLERLYENNKDKKILFVGHSHVIKSMLILADPKKFNMLDYYVDNGSIHYISFDGENFKFLGAKNQTSV